MTSPLFSIIIPAFHEAEIINRTAEHVMRFRPHFDIEIIVVDGDSHGSTISAIRNDRIIRLHAPRGRGRQMNAGANIAKGDILVFLHADTILPEDGLSEIERALRDRGIAAGAFDLGIDGKNLSYRFIEKLVALRSRATSIPYGDQAIFVRREIFFSLNGFEDIPIMEDVALMRSIKRSGLRISIIGRKVKTSSRRWNEEGVFRCTMRNWILVSLYLAGVGPEKLAPYYYRSYYSGR